MGCVGGGLFLKEQKISIYLADLNSPRVSNIRNYFIRSPDDFNVQACQEVYIVICYLLLDQIGTLSFLIKQTTHFKHRQTAKVRLVNLFLF